MILMFFNRYVANKGGVFFCETAAALGAKSPRGWVTPNGEVVNPLTSEIACEVAVPVIVGGMDPVTDTILVNVEMLGRPDLEVVLPSLNKSFVELEGFWYMEQLIVCGTLPIQPADIWCYQLVRNRTLGEYYWNEVTDPRPYVLTTGVSFARFKFDRKLVVVGGKGEQAKSIRYYDPATSLTNETTDVFANSLSDHCSVLLNSHVIVVDQDKVYMGNNGTQGSWPVIATLDRTLSKPQCALDHPSDTIVIIEASLAEKDLLLLLKQREDGQGIDLKYAASGFTTPNAGTRLITLEGKVAKVGGFTNAVELIEHIDFEEGNVSFKTLDMRLQQKRLSPIVIHVPTSFFSLPLNCSVTPLND